MRILFYLILVFLSLFSFYFCCCCFWFGSKLNIDEICKRERHTHKGQIDCNLIHTLKNVFDLFDIVQIEILKCVPVNVVINRIL